ncbi:MAG TPA: ribosome maturation factor RimM [Terriglobales bacterium]|nr:ribosome maturation factor RimM [Terriglobales bacterium]
MPAPTKTAQRNRTTTTISATGRSRSSEAMDMEYITIARVAKTQGRKGEVAADLHTDFPEKFAERKRLFALYKDGSRRELQVEDFWPHKVWMVLKFAGVDEMTSAEALIGCELQIPLAERAQLEEGAAYISDLVGITVFDGPTEVGEIRDVQFGSGEAPNLVLKSGTKEVLVPYAAVYIKRLDVAGKRLEMELPEGLLELQAPPAKAEKKPQQEH